MSDFLLKTKAIIKGNSLLLLLVTLTIMLWLLSFSSGLQSAASVWWGSEIFHHCAFVVPISIWLIYDKRNQLLTSKAKPNYLALPVIILLLGLQLIGFAGDIQIFQYAATFAILPVIACFVFGMHVCKKILFPLFFILFAIPVGDEIIPFLQNVTAHLSMFFLDLFSLPVYRGGLYIEIPNGKFYVAEACSGISFLIVSVVFGNLYAYLSFTQYNKKILFLVLSVIVPILANALRVFGIVLIGHYFGMEYAVGTDHLIYGWVFYCFVLFLLIFIGEKIRDPNVKKSIEPVVVNSSWRSNFFVKPLLILILLLLVLSVWQYKILKNFTATPAIATVHNMPKSITLTPLKAWQPKFSGYSASAEGKLNLSNNSQVDIYIAWYDGHSKGELISSLNHLFNKKRWVESAKKSVALTYNSTASQLNKQTLVNGNNVTRTVLYGYVFNDQIIASKLRAKIHHTWNVLKGAELRSAVIAISYPGNKNKQLDQHILTWLESSELQSLISGKP